MRKGGHGRGTGDMRVLVASLRGQLEEAPEERTGTRPARKLRAKFDYNRDAAFDVNQAVSQHDVVLDCNEVSHIQWLCAMVNGQLTDRCTRICSGHVEGRCRAPMRFPQRGLALDQRRPRTQPSEQQCVLGHRAAEHSLSRALRSLTQSARVQTAAGARPKRLFRQRLPFGIAGPSRHLVHGFSPTFAGSHSMLR